MTSQVAPVTLSALQAFITNFAPNRANRETLLFHLNTFAVELAKQVFNVSEDTHVSTLFSDARMPGGRCFRDQLPDGSSSYIFKFYSPITPNLVIGQVNMKVENGISENAFTQYIVHSSTNFALGDECNTEPVSMGDLTNPVSRKMASRLGDENVVEYSPSEAKEKLQWLRVRNDLSGRARIGKDLFDALDEYEDSNRYLDRKNVVKVRYKGETPQRANAVTIEIADEGVTFASVTITYSK